MASGPTTFTVVDPDTTDGAAGFVPDGVVVSVTGGGDGVEEAEAKEVALVAVMVTVPGLTAVTSPFGETVATFGSELVHTTVGFDETPFAAVPFAEARSVPPVRTEGAATLTDSP